MCLRNIVVLCVISSIQCSLPTDQNFWTKLAKDELNEALSLKWNTGTAKNVILFVGDGMGPNTITATRIYKGGESHRLAFERFPHVGLLKTYSANKIVPDSASAATALFCGVKANQMTGGVDTSVFFQDCPSSLRPEARLDSLAALALRAGKSAGLVTTMRVTHATPAPLYAHTADRKWECDTRMPAKAKDCKDIARQMVEDWPGRDLHVILGGGRQGFVTNATGADPQDPWTCSRKDGRDLIKTYKQNKEKRSLKYSYVTNTKGLQDVDINETDYLLGIFANGHLQYEHERDRSPDGQPSISAMVEAAIKVLRKNEKGYFLMVEGGNIDMAHHRGWAKRAVSEASAMEDAVTMALSMVDEQDTLVVVTSDHTHTLSINGYPYRGTSIFGIAEMSDADSVNYTTLSYSTGGPESFQYYVKENNTVGRRDPSLEDTESFNYKQAAAIRLSENSHGGGDVIIYAKGPHGHLFHNVHEQHYVYHAISYAAKMGAHSSNVPSLTSSSLLLCLVFILSIVNLILL